MGSRTKNKCEEARAQATWREKENATLAAQDKPPKWGPRLFGRQGRP